MNKKYLIITAIVIFLVSCSSDKAKELEKLKAEKEKIQLKIAELEKEQLAEGKLVVTKQNATVHDVAVEDIVSRTFNHYIEIQGKLDGEDNLGINAQMVGVIKSVSVKQGDFVKKGQVLAIINDDVIQQQIMQMKGQLDFLTTLYEKQKSLWEQQIGSEVQYLAAKNNKENMENTLKTLKEQMDMTRISSPIDGTVEEVSVKVGQAVSPGLPIFRVVNMSTIKIVADVSEHYTSKIKKGDKVVLSFPDISHDVESNVSFASRYINPINRTFSIEIRLVPDKNTEYRANMITIVKINDYHSEKAVAIPIKYLQNDSKGSFVFIAKQDGQNFIATKAYIKKGQEYNGEIEVTEGLNFGDKLVVAGYNNLEDGEIVKF